MKQSETIAELATALTKAQADMGGAVASAENPFFKSKYADLASVVRAIKEPFAKNGLSYVQFPCSGEGQIGVTTRLMHSSGEWLEGSYLIPMAKTDPQGAGSAITYARRYALQSMSGVPTADDDAASAMLKVGDDDLTEISAQLMASESMDDLASTFKLGWHSYPKSREALTVVYNSMKKELSSD